MERRECVPVRAVIRTNDERAVAPVIAEILLVAIAVTITAVVYASANNIVGQAAIVDRPFVVLGNARVQDGAATVPVLAVSRGIAPASLRVNLGADGSVGTPVTLPAPGAAGALALGSATYEIGWTDLGGSHLVTAGDTITVRPATGAFPAGTSYTLYLLWSDGSVLQAASWTT